MPDVPTGASRGYHIEHTALLGEPSNENREDGKPPADRGRTACSSRIARCSRGTELPASAVRAERVAPAGWEAWFNLTYPLQRCAADGLSFGSGHFLITSAARTDLYSQTEVFDLLLD